jgi:hypothetical protein
VRASVIRQIGFTGTQDGMMREQVQKLSELLMQMKREGATAFHHGDCVGADAEAHNIAKRYSFHIVGHPPVNPKKRAFMDVDESRPPQDYLVRNNNIVVSTDVLIACPKGMVEELRSGTWATLRRARDSLRPYCIIYPDGTTQVGKDKFVSERRS